jgi:DNA-binding CsgD family transcriptional regulator
MKLGLRWNENPHELEPLVPNGRIRAPAKLSPPTKPQPIEGVVTAPCALLGVRLSPRQNEVMELVAQGLQNKAIGNSLGCSALTVKNHVAQVLQKLGARNRTEAAVIYKKTAPVGEGPRVLPEALPGTGANVNATTQKRKSMTRTKVLIDDVAR